MEFTLYPQKTEKEKVRRKGCEGRDTRCGKEQAGSGLLGCWGEAAFSVRWPGLPRGGGAEEEREAAGGSLGLTIPGEEQQAPRPWGVCGMLGVVRSECVCRAEMWQSGDRGLEGPQRTLAFTLGQTRSHHGVPAAEGCGLLTGSRLTPRFRVVLLLP